MQAISGAGIGTNTSLTNQQVPAFLNNLMGTAVNTITPLTEVNDAATNFLSTVQNVKPSELPQMLTQIGIGAKIAQTPIEDLTQAATTMQIAFGRAVSPTTIGQFSRMWQMLVTTAPGGISASSTIAQSMPGLASMFQLAPGRHVPANVGQAQMMALSLGVLRTGMPAATGMRGLTYLLQSIAQPTGGAGKALSAIGITPQFVSQRGIFAALMRLLGTITHTGNVHQLAAIPDDAMDQLDTSGGNLPGIPPQEMSRLRQMIPRIHGIRAAIILASQLQQHGDVSSIQQDLKAMLDAQDTQSKEAHQLAQSWQNFRNRARLADAANAINTMGLQVAQTFEPVLGFVAQHALTPLARAARTHPNVTRDVTLGAGGFLAAMGIGRFLGVGRLPGIGRIPGIGKLLGGGVGNAFVQERAITAAVTGGAGLGATPQNPLYVTVVGQLFGGGTSGPTPPNDGGGGSFFSRVAGATGITALARRFGGFGSIARFGSEIGAAWMTKSWVERHMSDPILRHLGLNSAIGPIMWNPKSGRPYRAGLFDNYQLSMNDVHKQILSQARKVFGGNVEGVTGYNAAMWKGQADVNMTIDLRDPTTGRITRKRVHVPVDLWAGGRAPSHRGQTAKTVRSR
jgi:hypothetical protein